jgi:1,2-diacylglycerol 3-beta-glucosyltransferase
MIEATALALGAVYCLVSLLIALLVISARSPSGAPPTPTVSIVIAARNEELNIPALLDSLLQQTYPRDLLEILVVDDRSTDRTALLVQEYGQRYAHIRLVSVHLDDGHLRGKTNALTQGMEASSGEIIMITDADCVVPPGWVEEIIRHYTDTSIGVVAGFTALRDTDWFSAMQSLDWLVLLTIASGAVRMDVPLTAIGNNLSVRRTAYDRVGGYRQIPFSVTEDYALFRAVTSTAKLKARFPLDSRALVVSSPCTTWKELYRQKKRWFMGAKDIGALKMILFGLVYAFNLLLVLGIAFSGLQAILPALALKVCADLALAVPPLYAFRRWRLLLAFPLYEPYFILYVLLFPLILLRSSEIIWKERMFKS